MEHPIYVTADPATGLGAPGALVAPNMPNVAAPAALVQPAPVGSSGCSWVFPGGEPGRSSAQFFAGALMALNPGLTVRVLVSSAPMVEYG